MGTTWKQTIGLLGAVLLAGSCWAQSADQSETVKFYRLDFVVKEVESGKTLNSRAYSTVISSETRAKTSSIRAGDRIPAEKSYVDAGVNIDVREAHESKGELTLNVNVEISNMVSEAPGGGLPLIRQTRWASDAIVPLRKPTTLYSADDAASKRQLQLELTATPLGAH